MKDQFNEALEALKKAYDFRHTSDAARLLGVSRSALDKCIAGDREPSQQLMFSIAAHRQLTPIVKAHVMRQRLPQA